MTKRSAVLLALATASTACKHDAAPTSTTASTASAAATTANATSAEAAATSAAVVSAPAPKHSGPAKAHAPAEVVVALTTKLAVDGTPQEPTKTPASVALPKPDFGAPAPLVISGYPPKLERGMRDWLTWLGYSSDGTKFVGCGTLSPLSAKGAEKGNVCVVNEGGVTSRFGLDDSTGGNTFVGPKLAGAINTLKTGTSVDLAATSDNQLLTPKIHGDWPYAQDITLDAMTIDGTEKASGMLRFGGRVGREDPVYSVTLSMKPSHADLRYGAAWNAILQGPKNDELALVGHFFCMEWCNDIAVTRVTYGQIASLVYNDTGFRHHQKKEYAASRDLFLKATWANPKAPLPPYNLACAYALLGDQDNAKKALELAIAVDGDKVKARAKKDADFKAVLGDAWFKALTG